VRPVDTRDVLRSRGAPYVVQRSAGFVRVELADGGADVYIRDPSAGAMVNHASGSAVWDLMYELAIAGRFAVLPIGCGTCVPTPAMADELPNYAPRPITVVGSGGATAALLDC
jgi:hypothetical protein